MARRLTLALAHAAALGLVYLCQIFAYRSHSCPRPTRSVRVEGWCKLVGSHDDSPSSSLWLEPAIEGQIGCGLAYSITTNANLIMMYHICVPYRSSRLSRCRRVPRRGRGPKLSKPSRAN